MKLRLPFNRTLTTRLLIVFLLCVALPLALFGALLVIVSERALIENASLQSRETIQAIARGIDEEARQTALWAAALSSDEQIVSSARQFASATSESERAVAAQSLDRKITSFFDYTNKIGSIQILTANRTDYIYRNSPFVFEKPIPRSEWFRHAMENPGTTHFLQTLRSYSLQENRQPLLSVAIAPSPVERSSGMDLFLISFRVTALSPFYDNASEGRQLVLLNSSSQPILSSADGVIVPETAVSSRTRQLLEALSAHVFDSVSIGHGAGDESTFRISIRGQPYLVSDVEVPSPGWRLVSAIPYREITRSVASFSRVARYGALLLLVIFVVFIEVSFHEVIRPLRQVVARMGEVQGGDFTVTARVSGPEEIVRLGNAFNTMVREISRLTSEKEAEHRERARLELESLRLQINPHFLSNTLNSIRLMANMMHVRNIEEMTKALMKLVTASFGREGTFDEVSNEIQMLQSYIHIMKIRYGNNFDVTVNLAPETEELLMLRMLLQPIVENSILHGLQNLPGVGRIDIAVRILEGALVISISDNGIGMSEDAVREAMSDREVPSGGMTRVGIANVERRIKLNHGPEFGLQMESRQGSGTTTTIRLPILTQEDVDAPRTGS